MLDPSFGPRLRLFSRIVDRCAYIFQEAPATIFQELHNRLRTYAGEDPPLVGLLEQARPRRREPWLRCLLGSLEVPGLVRVLTGHTAAVTDCNFSPDGVRLVSSGGDGALRVWDVSSGELLQSIRLPYSDVWECDFTPDGTHLLALAGNGAFETSYTLVLVDPRSGLVAAASKVGVEHLAQCDVSRSGELLAMPGEDHCLELVAVDSGSRVSVLHGHSDAILACAFDASGTKLFSVGRDGRVLTWEVAGGRLSGEVSWEGKGVAACGFSPDLGHFVSGGEEGQVDLWRTMDGRRVAGSRAHEGPVHRCFYAPDGSAIVSKGGHNDLKLWDPVTLAAIGAFVDFGRAAPGSMSADGRSLATSGVGADYTAYLWNVKTGECETSLAAHTYELEACRFSPDGRYVVTASCDWTLIVWDAAVARSASPGKKAFGGAEVAFAPHGSRLLSEHFDGGTIRVLQAEDGQAVLDIRAHEKYINGGCSSPDGRLLATAGVDNDGASLKVWDSETGRELWRAEQKRGWPEACAFSEDGRYIIWQVDRYGPVRSCDARSGIERASIEDHWLADHFHPFGPDGRVILRGDSRRPAADGQKGEALVFWDAGTGQAEVAVDDGILLWDEAISPDGRTLGIADGERLRLIDLPTRRESASVSEDAQRCIFSPDARYVMSANSPDPNSSERRQLLRLRDTRTLALLRTFSFRISEDGTGGCGFSPDGRRVYWASDERVVIFDLAGSRQYLFRDKAGGLTGVSFCLDSARFAVGNGRGEVIVFLLEGADPGAPASTAIAGAGGHVLRCAWCAAENPLSAAQLGTVVNCRRCGRANAVNPSPRHLYKG